MEPLNLVDCARAAGLKVRLLGDWLDVRGPRDAEPFVRELGEHKAEVVAALRRRAESLVVWRDTVERVVALWVEAARRFRLEGREPVWVVDDDYHAHIDAAARAGDVEGVRRIANEWMHVWEAALTRSDHERAAELAERALHVREGSASATSSTSGRSLPAPETPTAGGLS